MSLDETAATQGQLQAFHRRVSPPANEVPSVVPVRHVLARAPGVVLSLLGARVFTTGVLLDLDVRLERRATPEQAVGLHEFFRPLQGEHVRADDRLAVGVALADGRAVELPDLRSGWWSPEQEARYADPAEPVLRMAGSGSVSGLGDSRTITLWLGPLPVPGPVVFRCAWPSLGVAASEVVLDGRELARAGEASEVLWPLVEDKTPEQLRVRYTGSYMPLGPGP